MEGEVNRVLQLTSSTIIPIMYQVPRKTYRDFHSDIFPDTNGYKSDLAPSDWLAGKNLPVTKLSLDPSKRANGEKPIIVSFIFILSLIHQSINKMQCRIIQLSLFSNINCTDFKR